MLRSVFLLIFLLALVQGCQITSPKDVVTVNTGATAYLQWNVLKPFNMIFGSINCGRGKTPIAKGSNIINFEKISGVDRRIDIKKVGLNYFIMIHAVTMKDSGIYKCSILCISNKGNFYSQNIQLKVEEHKDGSSNSPNRNDNSVGENDNDYWTTKRKTLVISIAATGLLLVILIVIIIVLCVRRKMYRQICFEGKEKQTDQNIDHPDFEETQYADLSDFQSTMYSELNVKSALWSNHEYAYVKTASLKKKDNHNKVSVSSADYDSVDPRMPLRKVSQDFDR